MNGPDGSGDALTEFLFGPYVVDCGQGVLRRDGAEVALTPKLFDTLRALVEAEGRLVSKDALIARVWPDTAVSDSSLTQNVWLLRRKIELEGERFIETVPRRGYRLIAPVLTRQAAQSARQPAVRAHIPRSLSPLVGRETTVAEIARLLGPEGPALVTLTGPGGVGKTRVALELAARADASLGRACWFVDLSAIADASLVPSAVARTLGLEDDLFTSIEESIAARLAAEPTLLVLDNFEHLLAATPFLATLASRVAGLKMLVTSRVLLRITGEHAHALDPLGVPRDASSVDDVGESAAGALFVRRVQAHRPSFRLTEAVANSVGRICRRLDGLPLALELAAARMRVLNPEQLDQQLASGLSPGPARRDAPDRHQTLDAALDWSAKLLGENARRRFEQLSVFAGSFTLDAVTAITGSDAIDDIQELVESSLVTVLDGPDELRYRLLETVRQYGLRRLTDGDRASLRRAHAAYYLRQAEDAGPALASPRRGRALDRIEADHENFRVAEATLSREDPPARLRLSVALGAFRHMRGHWQESLAGIRAALDACAAAPSAIRAAGLIHLARLDFFMGDEDRAREAAEEGLTLARAAGDVTSIARAADALAQVCLKVGLDDEGRRLAEEATDAARRAGDVPTEAEALTTLGTVRVAAADYDAARMILADALERATAIGDPLLAARVRYYLAGVALLLGEQDSALTLGSVEHDAGAADESWAHHLGEMRGRVLLGTGHLDEASRLVAGSLDAMHTVGSRTCIPHGLEAAARLLIARGDLTEAARLVGSAEAACQGFGVAMLPIERALYRQTVDGLRAALPQAEFDRVWQEGRRRPVEDALRRARAACLESAEPLA